MHRRRGGLSFFLYETCIIVTSKRASRKFLADVCLYGLGDEASPIPLQGGPPIASHVTSSEGGMNVTPQVDESREASSEPSSIVSYDIFQHTPSTVINIFSIFYAELSADKQIPNITLNKYQH